MPLSDPLLPGIYLWAVNQNKMPWMGDSLGGAWSLDFFGALPGNLVIYGPTNSELVAANYGVSQLGYAVEEDYSGNRTFLGLAALWGDYTFDGSTDVDYQITTQDGVVHDSATEGVHYYAYERSSQDLMGDPNFIELLVAVKR